MRFLARLLALAACVLVIGQSMLVWQHTGQKLFTQWPSASLAKMQEKPADDPFAGLGMNDQAGEPAKVDNEFRLGILPAGTGNNLADSFSVLTLGGPALLLFLLVLVFARAPKSST
jgi:hypothetical protein